jgi:hypothetical protein
MALSTQRGTDPAEPTTPMPTGDATLHLSTRTVTWLANQPHARRLVRSVWDTLTELERAGQHPEAIAALRRVLTYHQPTPAGRCRTCPRFTWRHLWRRRAFPCMVWHQVRGELLGVFASGGRHRQPGHHGRPQQGLSSH